MSNVTVNFAPLKYIPNLQAKVDKSSIFWLLLFVPAFCRQPVELIRYKGEQTAQIARYWTHYLICYCTTQTILEWFLSILMLMLSAIICHLVRITLFIASTSLEAEMITRLDKAYRKRWRQQQPKSSVWCNAKQGGGEHVFRRSIIRYVLLEWKCM